MKYLMKFKNKFVENHDGIFWLVILQGPLKVTRNYLNVH